MIFCPSITKCRTMSKWSAPVQVRTAVDLIFCHMKVFFFLFYLNVTFSTGNPSISQLPPQAPREGQYPNLQTVVISILSLSFSVVQASLQPLFTLFTLY